MEERGLVARSHGEADRRVVLVQLTDSGIAIFRDMTELRRQHLSAVLGRLTTEELAALLTGLRAMRAARLAIHAEKLSSGLVSVSLGPESTSGPGAPPSDTAPSIPAGEDA
jgi:DNA-binding PadR family transcriptional regulator